MATRYTQNVAVEQIPFRNFPGGGPLGVVGGIPGAQFNDPGIELGAIRQVTAIYQMYGNEVANDIINVYLAQPGDMVKPTGSVVQTGIASVATMQIGDDDITGYGLISSGVAFGTPEVPPPPALGADPARYANSLNVATGQNGAIAMVGGSALNDPYVIGTLAVEPPGASLNGVPLSPGAGIAGSWVQAKFLTLTNPVAGKCIIFRLDVIKPN